MPRKKKNIANNFRGKEDLFFTKIRNGLVKFLAPPSAHITSKRKLIFGKNKWVEH